MMFSNFFYIFLILIMLNNEMFGSAQKEWGHLVRPHQCLDLLPSPEPVAVHARSAYYFPTQNSSTK